MQAGVLGPQTTRVRLMSLEDKARDSQCLCGTPDGIGCDCVLSAFVDDKAAVADTTVRRTELVMMQSNSLTGKSAVASLRWPQRQRRCRRISQLELGTDKLGTLCPHMEGLSPVVDTVPEATLALVGQASVRMISLLQQLIASEKGGGVFGAVQTETGRGALSCVAIAWRARAGGGPTM